MAHYSRKSQKKPNATAFFIVAAIVALSIGVIGSYYQFKIKRNNAGVELFKPEPALEKQENSEAGKLRTVIPYGVKPDISQYAVQDIKTIPLPVALPDLLSSDSSFREVLTVVSPGLAPWLNTDHLIRKFFVVADDISRGTRIASHMSFLRLEQPFLIDQIDNVAFISERGFHRYDKLAEAIQAMNPEALAIVYQTFRPFLQVFTEINYPKEITLESIVKKVSADVLAAPIIEGRVEVVRPSQFYKFVDANLEGLSPIQKQMLRMGPVNTRIVQTKLREFMVEFAKLNLK